MLVGRRLKQGQNGSKLKCFGVQSERGRQLGDTLEPRQELGLVLSVFLSAYSCL
jgi:hypothetical protein